MAEYIEREALIEDLDAAAKHGGMGAIIAQTLKRYVKRATAADVAPVVHGRRIDYGGFYCRCSRCEGTLPFCSNYCPNCGARMDGARNGEED